MTELSGNKRRVHTRHEAHGSVCVSAVVLPAGANPQFDQRGVKEFVGQFKWALCSRQVFEWQKMTRPETLTDIQGARSDLSLQRFYRVKSQATGHLYPVKNPAELLRVEAESWHGEGNKC